MNLPTRPAIGPTSQSLATGHIDCYGSERKQYEFTPEVVLVPVTRIHISWTEFDHPSSILRRNL
jgi:hypothetical protein